MKLNMVTVFKTFEPTTEGLSLCILIDMVRKPGTDLELVRESLHSVYFAVR